ncbi:MAG: hypothetical protein VB126_08700 [Paludibacter sp.]|nr:hypothetical protein [Paludibacter sp.]
MKDQSVKTYIGFATTGTVLTIAGAISKILQLNISTPCFIIGFILIIYTWIITIADIRTKGIYNASFWLKSILIFPYICPLIYLIQRKRLTQP